MVCFKPSKQIKQQLQANMITYTCSNAELYAYIRLETNTQTSTNIGEQKQAAKQATNRPKTTNNQAE